MNKIFKVVWSKVRNAYVVVSEIAKNTVSGVGKRNRVKRFSMGATLAAVALTSSFFLPSEGLAAVTALETAKPEYYIAIGGADKKKNPFANNANTGITTSNNQTYINVQVGDQTFKYIYTTVTVNGQPSHYWIRDGFGVKAITKGYHPEASELTLDLYKIPGTDATYEGMTMSGEHTLVPTSVTTAINGTSLEQINYVQYAALTNSGGTGVLKSYNYFINRNGQYVDVGGSDSKLQRNFYVFKADEFNALTGKYTFKGQDVEYDNVYEVGGRIGVFLNKEYTETNNRGQVIADAYTTNKDSFELGEGYGIYGGTVYGKYNEILLSGYNSITKKWSTVWAAEITDQQATVESMTLNEFNEILHHLHEEDVKLANEGIVKTAITSGVDTHLTENNTISNGGSINLVNKAGNQVPGFTMQSLGGTGGNYDDTYIRVKDADGKYFDLKTGTLVVANDGVEYEKGASLTSLTVNGNRYTISGGGVSGDTNKIAGYYKPIVSGEKRTLSWVWETGNPADSFTYGDLKGADGSNGVSAYEIWKEVTNNTNATKEDFINSLKGQDGESVTVTTSTTGNVSTIIFHDKEGDKSVVINHGVPGVDGKDAPTIVVGSTTTVGANAQANVTGEYNEESNTLTLNFEIPQGGNTGSTNANDKYLTGAGTNKNEAYAVQDNQVTLNVENGEAVTITGIASQSELATVKTVAENANKGWNLKVGTGDVYDVLPDSTVTLKSDDNNLTVVGDKKGVVTFDFSDTPSFTSASIGGKVSISSSGINMSGTQITGLADGVDASDAVNVGQLNAVQAVVQANSNQVNAFNFKVTSPTDKKVGLVGVDANGASKNYGGVTLSTTGGTGGLNDPVQLVVNDGTSSFSVTTGSIVSGTKGNNKTLSQITINGETFNLFNETHETHNVDVFEGVVGDDGKYHGWYLTDKDRKDGKNVLLKFGDTTLVDRVVNADNNTYTITDTAGNAVVLTDVASAQKVAINEGNITKNTNAIESLTSRVNANKDNIKLNQTKISNLSVKVATNEANIDVNKNKIIDLTNKVAANKANIVKNASDISDLADRVTVNEGNITTNTNAISALNTRVTDNYSNSIKSIDIVGGTGSGTIGLSRNVGTVPGALTISTSGGTDGSGDDLQVLIANKTNNTDQSIVLTTGSLVSASIVGGTNNTLDGIVINGTKYYLPAHKTDSSAFTDWRVGSGNHSGYNTYINGLQNKVSITSNSYASNGYVVDDNGVIELQIIDQSAPDDGVKSNVYIANVAKATDLSALKDSVGDVTTINTNNTTNISGNSVVNHINNLYSEVNTISAKNSDWRLVGAKTSQSSAEGYVYNGAYTVGEDGNIVLNVQDQNSDNKGAETVVINNVAKASDIGSISNITGVLAEGAENNVVNHINNLYQRKTVVKGVSDVGNILVESNTVNGVTTYGVSLNDNIHVENKVTVGNAITLNGGTGSIRAHYFTGQTVQADSSFIVGGTTLFNGYLTGLQNRTWEFGGEYISGRAATEDQLQDIVEHVDTHVSKLKDNDIAEIRLASNGEGGTVSLLRNNIVDGEHSVVPGSLTFTSGFDTNRGNQVITISGNNNQQILLDAGSVVSANGTNGALSQLNVNGEVYNIVDNNTTLSSTSIAIDSDGNLTVVVTDTSGKTVSNTVDISGYVQGVVQQLDIHAQAGQYDVGTNIVSGSVEAVSDGNDNTQSSTNNTNTVVNDSVVIPVVQNGNEVGNIVITDVASAQELDEEIDRSTQKDNAHDSSIAINADNIATNANNIQANADNIAINANNIQANADNIATNTANIAKGWNSYVNGTNVQNIQMGGSQNFEDGTNIKMTADDDGNIIVSTAKEVSFDKVTVGSIVVDADGINAGSKKIINVDDGKIDKDSKDAINGSQMYEAHQAIISNYAEIQNLYGNDKYLDSRINQLGSKVNKVGAGAAALAALHPMDFDPDDKLSFAVGAGNYAGETATALGAFYRPNEKVMMNVAGTYGNGENMVNMGVSFALDRTNHVSNSRTAMAKEIVDLREQVATQGQQIAQLVALVQQLAGVQQPVVPAEQLFPDVPENHWAYEYVNTLVSKGIIEGYPDGTFGGDRTMTRYEFAAMLFRAMEQGVVLSEQIRQEFEKELGRVRVDRVKGADNDPNKIERVRVNKAADRDNYGSKIVQVKH